MKKYILELREPTWRRYLRWTLWTLIAVFVLAAAWTGITTAISLASEYQLKQSTQLLSALNPRLGVLLAEDFYRAKPTNPNRLLTIHAAMDAEAWDLADALLEHYRQNNDNSVVATAYDVITLAHVAPETLSSANKKLASLKPENDIEKLAFAQAAVVSGDETLQQMAPRLLAQLVHTPMRDDSALVRARLSLAMDNQREAKERVLSLIDQNLSPSHSIELLELLQKLDLPEYDAYLSSLSLRSRGEIILCVELLDYLWDQATNEALMRIIESARPIVQENTQIKIRQIVLLQKMNKQQKALDIASTLSEEAQQEAFRDLIEGKSPNYYKIKSKKDWVNLLVYAQHLGNLTLQNNLTKAMADELAQSAWAAQAMLESARAQNNTTLIAQAFEKLSRRLPDVKIVKLRGAYWQMMAQTHPDTRMLYKQIKELAAGYEGRCDTRLSLGLAYFFLGSTTDALFTLNENPTAQREKFLRGYVLAQAGQAQNATRMLAHVDADKLTTTERSFLKATQTKLLQDSPVQKLFDILQAE